MKQYAVIFDMDGVIADTNPTHSEAFRQFFDSRNIPHSEEEFAKHMYGKHNSYIMNYFFHQDLDPEEVTALAEEKEALFRKLYAPIAKPIDGLLPFVDALRGAGMKTAIATSAPKANLDLVLDCFDLHARMDSLLSSEDVTRYKPDPDIYLKTADRLGVSPEDCVVFEDSYSGVSAAINAEMKVVGVLTSHTKEELPPCQYYIQDYRNMDIAVVLDLLGTNHKR